MTSTIVCQMAHNWTGHKLGSHLMCVEDCYFLDTRQIRNQESSNPTIDSTTYVSFVLSVDYESHP